jgi:hypothetical protein
MHLLVSSDVALIQHDATLQIGDFPAIWKENICRAPTNVIL